MNQIPLTFAQNPEYVATEALILKLHNLFVADQEDSDEADSVRDQLDKQFPKLTRAEKDRLNNLSGDLFQLMDAEVYEPVDDPQDRSEERMAPLLEEAKIHQNWSTMLTLLRKGPEYLPSYEVAYLRAWIYSQLGHMDVALNFAEYAIRHNPTYSNYRQLRLLLLAELRRHDEALIVALDELQSSDARPLALFVGANLCYKTAFHYHKVALRTLPNNRVPELVRFFLEKVVAGLSKLFKNFAENFENLVDFPSEHESLSAHQLLSLWLIYAHSLGALGEIKDAETVYRAVLNFQEKISEYQDMRDVAERAL